MDRARLALGFALLASAASAHTEKIVKRDAIAISPTEIRLELDYVVPAGEEARSLRELFDRDRSGALDARERTALGEYLAAQATRFVTISVDDRRVELARVGSEPELGGSGAERMATTVKLRARVSLAADAHHLTLADRHKDRRITVPVTVRLDGLALTGALAPQPVVFEGHPLELELTALRSQ